MDRGKSENLIVDEVRQYGHGNCSTNKQIKGKEKTTQTLSTQRTRKSVLVGVGGGGRQKRCAVAWETLEKLEWPPRERNMVSMPLTHPERVW